MKFEYATAFVQVRVHKAVRMKIVWKTKRERERENYNGKRRPDERTTTTHNKRKKVSHTTSETIKKEDGLRIDLPLIEQDGIN